jgi:hypothetical protein
MVSVALYFATFEVRYGWGNPDANTMGVGDEPEMLWTSCGTLLSPHWRTRLESDLCYRVHDQHRPKAMALAGAAAASAVAAAVAWRHPARTGGV